MKRAGSRAAIGRHWRIGGEGGSCPFGDGLVNRGWTEHIARVCVCKWWQYTHAVSAELGVRVHGDKLTGRAPAAIVSELATGLEDDRGRVVGVALGELRGLWAGGQKMTVVAFGCHEVGAQVLGLAAPRAARNGA